VKKNLSEEAIDCFLDAFARAIVENNWLVEEEVESKDEEGKKD
jgi:hypothetical protein